MTDAQPPARVGGEVVLAQDPQWVAHNDVATVELAEVLQRETREVVSANVENGYIIMKERDPGLTNQQSVLELGYTAPSPFTSWTRVDENAKLRDQQGIKVYYNMRRSDGVVRAILRLLKTPPMAGHWFVEPADDSTMEKNKAEFVEDNLFNRMNVAWETFLMDAFLMADYGYMCFEKVFTNPNQETDGKVRLAKLAPRHPLDIQEWRYDRQGGPDGCVMYPNPYSGPSPVSPGTGMDALSENFIPISKLVVFSHEPEAGDITGVSILRSAYKHWYYKDTLYKIDAIQKERHGIGVPIITLPPGYTNADKTAADNLGRNLRSNERAHVTLPPGWTLEFAKMQTQPVDCLKSIEHHDMRIKANVLGAFLDEAGVTKDATDIFLKSTRYLADYLCAIINKHVIPQLCDFNFKRGKYPKLRARRIGEWEDLRTLTFALRNLVGADLIRPDDKLEEHLRKESDLPPADPATARTPLQVRPPIAAPPQTGTPENDKSIGQQVMPGQQPGTSINGAPQNDGQKAGGTRQQAKPPVGPPRSNAGTDRSGGK